MGEGEGAALSRQKDVMHALHMNGLNVRMIIQARLSVSIGICSS
jgi:hypothetical protein